MHRSNSETQQKIVTSKDKSETSMNTAEGGYRITLSIRMNKERVLKASEFKWVKCRIQYFTWSYICKD
ncbi:hypothetical protein XELAEV_18008503mg [Xenopus laevis]|uniref:Uncharacterized protein n=1 Tax=Xenopus laevis TaxID=8355 RepID=A0A974E3K6_XENLA|nr:hypothetical protein XELAEV_18008503mg [Xenopus laevis]